MRNAFRQNIGNIAIGDGWLVSVYSPTQLLIADGQAWFDGLPYDLKSSRDNQVTLGIAPAGVPVALTDEPTGLGKLLTFTTGATPTTDFRIVITAREQIITSLQDPFLQDVTVPEPTEEKIRLYYTVDIVTASNQGQVVPYDQSSPVPYVGEALLRAQQTYPILFKLLPAPLQPILLVLWMLLLLLPLMAVK